MFSRKCVPILFVSMMIGVFLFAFSSSAFASSGRRSNKDQCHSSKGEKRHYHFKGTNERAGICKSRNGKTVYVSDKPVISMGELERKIKDLRRKIRIAGKYKKITQKKLDMAKNILFKDDFAKVKKAREQEQLARDDAEAAISRANEAISASRTYRINMENSERAEKAAMRLKDKFKTIAREAEDRARGKGPRVDLRCRSAINKFVIQKSTGYFSKTVKVTEKERRKLRVACLDNL